MDDEPKSEHPASYSNGAYRWTSGLIFWGDEHSGSGAGSDSLFESDCVEGNDGIDSLSGHFRFQQHGFHNAENALKCALTEVALLIDEPRAYKLTLMAAWTAGRTFQYPLRDSTRTKSQSMWPDSEQTQELLRSAGDGDASAVNQLLNRHRDAVRKMVHLRMDRAVAARVDASDVVQDVMLEANQRLSDYIQNPSMPFHLWLRQLAKDRLIDMHRRHRGAQRRSVDRERSLNAAYGDQSSLDLAAQLRDHELTPAAATIRRELEERFLAALAELVEDDRDIIVMRHQEHLSNSEVAEALNLSSAAAGMRYLRALRRLRDVLGTDHSGSINS